jgi:hypothetical protein
VSVEVVRGAVDAALAGELVAFWTANGALDEAGARERLPEVVCVVRDRAGAVAGVSSAVPAVLALIGGRRFWVMRKFVLAEAADEIRALERATFAALEREFDADGPIGLCIPLTPAEAARRPEAVWPEPRTFFAGFLPGGLQARVAYFEGASVVPGRPPSGWAGRDVDLGGDPPIEVFDEQDVVDEQAVADFWVREDAVDAETAQQRVRSLHLVALAGGEVVAVTTRYLQRNAQLGLDMWHYRGFVGAAHRGTLLGMRLGIMGRDHLEERFATGRDRRAPGIIWEVENEGLRTYAPEAIWAFTDFVFIGENERGDHVRVHWFPGARAPLGQGRT